MTESKRGRPGTQLVSERLRKYRNEKGLTQREVANELVKAGILSKGSSEKTSVHSYHRIEKFGRTSPETATELAKLFGVSVAVLEGKEYPEPADYEAQMLALLKKQLAGGGSPALDRDLKQETNAASNGEPPERALQRLARNICYRIESAQLARNPDELESLADLIGLSSEEILKPANAEGYWLLRISDFGADGLQTEIVRGTLSVASRIRELVGDRLDRLGSDGEIRLRRDGYWYRIETAQPLLPYPMRIDFVRCRPEADGLRWLRPAPEEEFCLDELLLGWANDAANFVTGFDGVRHPADVTRLRLLIDSGNGESIAISTKIPDALMANFSRESPAHAATQSLLTKELEEFLEPRLKEYPARCLNVTDLPDAISIWSLPDPKNFPDGLRYQVLLVEELEPGKYVRAPWRLKDKSDLKSRLEQWLS